MWTLRETNQAATSEAVPAWEREPAWEETAAREPEAGRREATRQGEAGLGRSSSAQQPLPEVVLIGADEEVTERVAVVAAGAGLRLRVARTDGLTRAATHGTGRGGGEGDASGPPRDGPGPAPLIGLGVERAPEGAVVVAMEADAARAYRLAAATPSCRVALLPQAEGWLGEFLGAAGQALTRGRVIAVGHLGASRSAASLALSLCVAANAQGHAVVVVDADPLGCLRHVVRVGPGELGWERLGAGAEDGPLPGLAGLLPAVRGVPVLTWSATAALDVGAARRDEVVGALAAEAEVVVLLSGAAAWPRPSLPDPCAAGLLCVDPCEAALLPPHPCRDWAAVVVHDGAARDGRRTAAALGLDWAGSFPADGQRALRRLARGVLLPRIVAGAPLGSVAAASGGWAPRRGRAA